VDIKTAWETVRENIKISAKKSLGYYKLKKQKPWFEELWSKLLDKRKQAKRNKWGKSEKYKTRSLHIFQE
jgi:hypothetical protein